MKALLEATILFAPIATVVLALVAAALFSRTLNGAMRSFVTFFLLQAAAYAWLGATEVGLRMGASWLEAREIRALVFRLLTLAGYAQLVWRLRW